MPHPPVDLAGARVLIANDDGIHAPGLKMLEKVMRAGSPAKSGWWRRRASRAPPAIR